MPLTAEQKKVVFHLGYEWWMFKTAHELLMDLQPRHEALTRDPVRNALVEAVVLHGRALLFFFYGTKREDSDWHVSDLGAGLPRAWPPPASLDSWRQDANERVAHLTETRRSSMVEWNVPAARPLFQTLVQAVKTHFGAEMPHGDEWIGDDPTTSALINVARAPRAAGDAGTPVQPTGPAQPAA